MAYAPDAAFTTSPCVKGFSGGASFPGGAGTLGFSKTDKGCDTRQTAVVFHAIGNDEAAALLLCSTDAAKRAHLTLAQCMAIVPPVPPVVVPAPIPAPPQIIVVPVPAQAPVPVVEEHSKSSLILHNVGTCRLPNGRPTNACYRMLDDAVLVLETYPNSRIVLTGPLQSDIVVSYLRKRVSQSRIELKLADEQNTTMLIQTEIGE